MKGIIDTESGTTLNRVLERLMDRGRPGTLSLISQPEGKRAELEMGADEVKGVKYENLSGEDAIKAINQLPLWSFEFTEISRQAVTREPKVLRPVLRSAPKVVTAASASAPAVEIPAEKPQESPKPQPVAVAVPEEIEEVIPAAPPKDPQAAVPTPAPQESSIPVIHLAYDNTGFTPTTYPTDEQEFIKGDYGYLYHQAKSIGRCIGLTNLQSFAYAEDRGVRCVAYRSMRGSAFRGTIAEEPANALQMLSTLDSNPPR
jgi:hypothetical protein